ncbi:MAG: hypothetical protein APU95_01845 [Hadesarchaea archaeon YNP_N21]|nr:MAG: hypothetical protein APU95_01845 [Hadesarchaea archaeon YNP_N21]
MVVPPIIAQALVNGIILGGVYLLFALGLNLIWGVMKVLNLFHGELLMIAMYFTYFAFNLYGLDPLVSLPIVAIALFFIGLIIHEVFIYPIVEKPVSIIYTTIGLMSIFQNVALLLWTSDYRVVYTEYTGLSFSIGFLRVPFIGLISLTVSLLTASLLYVFLMKTRQGKIIRATSQDIEAAALNGINVHRVYLLTYGLGALITGVSGALLMLNFYVFPQIGPFFLLTALVIIVLGGIGSFVGALIGSFIIGISEALSGALLNIEFAKCISLAIFILILLFRPSGIISVEKSRV